MKKVYLVVGCPGSGKSWVCERAAKDFHYVRHDDHISKGKDYVKEIVKQSKSATKPLLIETPFSVSQVKEPLEKQGFEVVPLYIQEKPDVIKQRYKAREGREIPDGHLTRQETYGQRAKTQGAFAGSSTEILQKLHNVAPKAKLPWE